jgi:hypothetical protein
MRRSSLSAPDLKRQRSLPARSPSRVQQDEETDTRATDPPPEPGIVSIQHDDGNEDGDASIPPREVKKADMYKGGAVEVC